MPSFVFFSNREPNSVAAKSCASAECIVPAGFDGVRGEIRSQHSTLKWHCGEQAPVELYESSESGFAFLLGYLG